MGGASTCWKLPSKNNGFLSSDLLDKRFIRGVGKRPAAAERNSKRGGIVLRGTGAPGDTLGGEKRGEPSARTHSSSGISACAGTPEL